MKQVSVENIQKSGSDVEYGNGRILIARAGMRQEAGLGSLQRLRHVRIFAIHGGLTLTSFPTSRCLLATKYLQFPLLEALLKVSFFAPITTRACAIPIPVSNQRSRARGTIVLVCMLGQTNPALIPS